MSIYTEDLRNHAGYLGELAADEIDSLEQELSDCKNAYELLFKENAKKNKVNAALVSALEAAIEELNFAKGLLSDIANNAEDLSLRRACHIQTMSIDGRLTAIMQHLKLAKGE